MWGYRVYAIQPDFYVCLRLDTRQDKSHHFSLDSFNHRLYHHQAAARGHPFYGSQLAFILGVTTFSFVSSTSAMPLCSLQGASILWQPASFHTRGPHISLDSFNLKLYHQAASRGHPFYGSQLAFKLGDTTLAQIASTSSFTIRQPLGGIHFMVASQLS